MDADNPYTEFDDCVEQFESSWRSQHTPSIDEFLAGDPCCKLSEAQRDELLYELIMIDLEYRWRRATRILSDAGNSVKPQTDESGLPHRPRLDDYLERFGHIRPERLPVELIAAEYRVRHRWGDRPSHQEFLDRFPDLERSVRQELLRIDARLPPSSCTHGLRIRCPHCHDSIQLGDHSLIGRITCPSCTARFNLVGGGEQHRRLGSNERVGPFELSHKLGSGSFGTVWQAHDTALDRLVAIKVPHPGLFDTDQHEQFLREARTTAQLSHPHIVPVYEVGREDDRLFIVTELIKGANLADWLVDSRPTPHDAASLCEKIADALEHAHRRGVVHRDLKPSNIMLDEDGEPRLMDFGLAKRVTAEATMTVEGKVLGTPAYMSPEQARGSAHEADQRADIYSLGAILFELLTGDRPFAGNVDVLLSRIISEDAISPRKWDKRIPKDLETICLKCLEKNPDQRFPTAAQLRDELRRFLRGEPVHVRPITRVDRAWRWCNRNRTLALLGTVATSLLLLFAVAGPIVAFRQARLAARESEALTREAAAREQKEWQLYLSDMQVALQAWEEGNVTRVRELLDRHVPQADLPDLRNFEWYYLWKQCQRSQNATTLAHDLPLSLLAYSADGKTLASGSAQVGYRYEIRLWNLASAEQGRITARLKIDREQIWAAAIAPNLQTVALGYVDGTIKLRNIVTGNQEIVISGHQAPILSLSFSVDGTALASRSRRQVKLWTLATPSEPMWTVVTGELPTQAPPVWFTPMAFSPNGEVLAWGSTGGRVTLCDARSGTVLRKLEEHRSTINAVTFSPDGQTLASASLDHTAKLWDVTSGKRLHSLDAHRGFVVDVAFSVDGKALATASQDNTVKLWNVELGTETDTLKGHATGVTSVAFSPRGDRLATGGEAHTVKLWDLENEHQNDLLEGHQRWIWSTTFSPDGRTLASCSWDGTIKLWDVRSGKLTQTITGNKEWVWCVVFSPDGKSIVSGSGILRRGSRRGRVKRWDVATGELRAESSIPTTTVRSVAHATNPDSNMLAVGVEDGQIMLLDASTLQLIEVLGKHADSVLSVAYSPDGHTLASGGRDNLVKLWDKGGHRRDLAGHTSWVFSLAFSPVPGTGLLATASRDNTVRLWHVTNAATHEVLRGHGSWVTCVDFSPDGETIVSGDSFQTIRLWDVRTRQLRVTFNEHKVGVFSVAFSPDGNTLAAGDMQNGVRLWRSATRHEVEAIQRPIARK